MQNIDSLVVSLLSNTKLLLQKYIEMKECNDNLTREVEQLKAQLTDKQIELDTKKEELVKIETRQVAENSHLTRETKSRIDELIIKVDDCINLLSE